MKNLAIQLSDYPLYMAQHNNIIRLFKAISDKPITCVSALYPDKVYILHDCGSHNEITAISLEYAKEHNMKILKYSDIIDWFSLWEGDVVSDISTNYFGEITKISYKTGQLIYTVTHGDMSVRFTFQCLRKVGPIIL